MTTQPSPTQPSNVRIFIQDFAEIDKTTLRGLTSDWNLPRKFAIAYTTPLNGEDAAEQAFFILNAPTDYLNEYEQQIAANYKGHSLSVGDIVEVDGKEFLCSGIGWMVRDQNNTAAI